MSACRRTIVVTGASSGIGAAVAVRLAEESPHLVLLGHKNVMGLQQTFDRVELPLNQVRCVIHDLSQSKWLASLVESIFAWQGHVDAWINMAGADVLTGQMRHRSFEEKLQLLWEVDVRSTMLLSRLVARRMIEQSDDAQRLPSIINVGWDQSEQGMEGDSGQYFCAIKSAVTAFTKSLAKSVGPKVRVNCVAPGWIRTAWGNQTSSDWDERARAECILGRWGLPEDVAEVIAFLASDRSQFVNGQVISVNGGWKHR